VIRICFVCLGNICRSPTAEVVMRGLVRDAGLSDRIAIDSAGTGDWHLGHPPDKRTLAAAKARGLELDHRAQLFTRDDFARFELVIAMDHSNRANLEQMAPDAAARAKIRLLRSFDPASPPGAEVPDPYYGGARGFEDVLDICEAACRGLLDHLRGRLAAG
jgi:protein-tyrosine phosphatase